MHKLSTITLADIDVGFDFTSDCPYWDGFWEKDEMGHIGCDPDIKSPNLRKYHQA